MTVQDSGIRIVKIKGGYTAEKSDFVLVKGPDGKRAWFNKKTGEIRSRIPSPTSSPSEPASSSTAPSFQVNASGISVSPSQIQPGSGISISPSQIQLGSGISISPSQIQPGGGIGISPSQIQPAIGIGISPSQIQPGSGIAISPNQIPAGVGIGISPGQIQPGSGISVSPGQLQLGAGISISPSQLGILGIPTPEQTIAESIAWTMSTPEQTIAAKPPEEATLRAGNQVVDDIHTKLDASLASLEAAVKSAEKAPEPILARDATDLNLGMPGAMPGVALFAPSMPLTGPAGANSEAPAIPAGMEQLMAAMQSSGVDPGALLAALSGGMPLPQADAPEAADPAGEQQAEGPMDSDAAMATQLMQLNRFHMQQRLFETQKDIAAGIAPERFKEGFRPMQLCKQFRLSASCVRGDGCSYAHTFEELHPMSSEHPDAQNAQFLEPQQEEKPPEKLPEPPMKMQRKRQLCQRLGRGQCMLGHKCPFAHSEAELGTVALAITGNVKTYLCKYHSQGKCVYGKYCVNAHGERELGQPRPEYIVPPKKTE